MFNILAAQSGSAAQARSQIAKKLTIGWNDLDRASAFDGLLIRILDFVIALLGLIFFAPLMGAIALAIWSLSAGPVIFKQVRVGRGGAPFSCYKFRTMRPDSENILRSILESNGPKKAEWERDHKIRDDPRVSEIGRMLRRTSLDELPQLINVLQGHMSIVGPRPITYNEVARYGDYIWNYLAVRPGITGLWQVCGRSQTTYRRRVACDVLFARRRSLLTYLRIVAVTVPVVLTGYGAC
jgi:exopolysaccharide production protein ExoY